MYNCRCDHRDDNNLFFLGGGGWETTFCCKHGRLVSWGGGLTKLWRVGGGDAGPVN